MAEVFSLNYLIISKARAFSLILLVKTWNLKINKSTIRIWSSS